MTTHHEGGELRGKVAVVTGAGGAIGSASARRLAGEGARVLLADIDAGAAQRATEAIAADGHDVHFVRADVTLEEDVKTMIACAVGDLGGLDIVFSNAGTAGETAPTAKLDQAAWDRIIAVNLTGTFLVMKHGIAAMKGRRGTVINNASVLGLVGMANHPAYSAAKGGVIALTRTAALECATHDIRVNCICPGFVETPMISGSTPTEVAAARVLKVLQPMRRFGTPAEIAEVVAFLASDRSSFMNGAIVPVDGGYVAR